MGTEVGKMSNISQCVIIGSSRGLGAALADHLLVATSWRVFGVSRSGSPPLSPANAGERYSHVPADISTEAGRSALEGVARQISGPCCVIYNAACVEKDFIDGVVSGAAMERIAGVGIDGLNNSIAVFQDKLLTYGGMFVGITSHWGNFTPVCLPYIAYPATKAYLDSVLRSLSSLWPPHAAVVSVVIGNVKYTDSGLPVWLVPTYEMAAKRIVSRLVAGRTPSRLVYPRRHACVYLLLRWVPRMIFRLAATIFYAFERRKSVNSGKAQ